MYLTTSRPSRCSFLLLQFIPRPPTNVSSNYQQIHWNNCTYSNARGLDRWMDRKTCGHKKVYERRMHSQSPSIGKWVAGSRFSGGLEWGWVVLSLCVRSQSENEFKTRADSAAPKSGPERHSATNSPAETQRIRCCLSIFNANNALLIIN